ncbi:hypothetical protein BDN72DRAFT_404046 [Pluteus cervinus]|uniref:Uncharacterized protein n=1 Tax=Pluteus cervinus TaxID=181527 RepID=A0ACD3ABI3_9AGAR|nr:hypothetical protein BDN72DRAFT_404046 [Pluteus cervinus]
MRQDQSSEPIIEKPHDSSLEHTSRPEQVPQVPHSMEHVPTITVISEPQEVIVSRSSDPPRSPDERAPPSEGIPEKASESHQERPAQAQTQSPIPSIPDTEKDAQGDVKMQDRSHSPQRYPKSRTTIPPSRGTPHSYSVPKSPPRGPRGVKPQTLIASSLPQYTPTGPRGRRPYQPAAPSEPQQDTSAQRVQETEPEYKIPLVGGKARTWFDPDPEIKRTQQRIYYLAEKHSELSRDLRRAMHELDMSTIDLHAAECRRKYAEQQMDRARNGILAMDEVPTTMS